MAVEKTLTCPLCEALCGLTATVEDNRVIKLRPDHEDPLSRGAVCPKGLALAELHEDPDRVRSPLIRTQGGDFAPASWDDALNLCADRLAVARRQHGRHAVGLYFGNPLVHSTGGILFSSIFARKLKTRNNFSATSLDQLPQMLAAFSMFGHQLMLPVPDVDRTDYLIIAGANPLVSNGSLMSAPGFRKRMQAIKSRGKVVVIDPRMTETARLADEHHFVRPGCDAWWLAALARTVFEELGSDLKRLSSYVDGVDEAREALSAFTCELAEERSGVSAPAIRAMAKALRSHSRAVVYGRIGICTQAYGGLCAWLINLINLISGHLDSEGGAMFATPAVDALELARRLGRTGRFDQTSASVRGLPRFAGELPTACLADEILRTDEPIRAMVTAAGNPVLSAPNGRRLDKAFSQLDFMVSIDPYINETTQHAEVILPPASPLERYQYDIVFHALAVQNTAKYSPAVLDRADGQLDDGEIFVQLKTRLDQREGKPLRGRIERWLLGGRAPERLLDLGLRLGPHPISLQTLRKNPSGVDLGPLRPRLPERLFTPDKRIKACAPYYVEDLSRLLHDPEPVEELQLIGRRELRSNNSWMHNLPSLVSGRPRCTLLMHPHDAAHRDLTEGMQVSLQTQAGCIQAQLSISSEMMRGVVSLPHGYGHTRNGVKLAVADRLDGPSVNDLNEERRVDALTGNAAFSGQPVRVQRIS